LIARAFVGPDVDGAHVDRQLEAHAVVERRDRLRHDRELIVADAGHDPAVRAAVAADLQQVRPGGQRRKHRERPVERARSAAAGTRGNGDLERHPPGLVGPEPMPPREGERGRARRGEHAQRVDLGRHRVAARPLHAPDDGAGQHHGGRRRDRQRGDAALGRDGRAPIDPPRHTECRRAEEQDPRQRRDESGLRRARA
jgi:hypothetical protein